MFLLGLCCVLQPFLCVALLLPHQWATKSAADTQTPLDTRGSAKDPLLRGRGGSRRETAAAVSRAPLLGLLSGLCTRACESGAAETAGSPTKLKIPKNTIGLGTCCVTGKECYDRVLEGLALGYRVIDTATHYENEAEVGEALDEGLRRGYLKAEEAFVISKVWFDDMGYEKALASFKRSKRNLPLLSCYLIHFPGANESRQNPVKNKCLRKETWQALEEVSSVPPSSSSSGNVLVGLSNFKRRHLKEILSYATTKPAAGSLELHPYLQEEELVKLYRDKGIRLFAHSPLGHGSLGLLGDSRTLSLAEKYKITPAQVVLKWHLQKGFLPIAASKSRDRLRENLAISKAASQGRAEIEFDVKDMNILASMEKNARCGFDPNLIA